MHSNKTQALTFIFAVAIWLTSSGFTGLESYGSGTLPDEIGSLSEEQTLELAAPDSLDAVSYTHLDVYKRQVLSCRREASCLRQWRTSVL